MLAIKIRLLDLSADLANLSIRSIYFSGIIKDVKRGGGVKYLIAWLLGIPIAVLLLIWLSSHLF
jgi:hypothetical protein